MTVNLGEVGAKFEIVEALPASGIQQNLPDLRLPKGNCRSFAALRMTRCRGPDDTVQGWCGR